MEKRDGLTEILANMPWIAITCPLFLDSLSFFSFFVSSPNPEPTIRSIKRFLERGKVHPKLWDFERAKYPVRPYSFKIFSISWPLVRYYPTYDSRDISGYFWLFVAVLPWHCNLSNAIGLENFFWGTMWKSAYKWKSHIINYSHVLWYKKRAFDLFPIRETNGCKSMQNEAITLQGWNVLASTPIAYLGNWKFCKFWPSVNSDEFIYSESVSL